MKIAKNTVVTVHYKLSDAQNNMLETGRNRLFISMADTTIPCLHLRKRLMVRISVTRQ